jgi:hypothetical protein
MKDDPEYAEAINHVQERRCTEEDVDLFNSRLIMSASNLCGINMESPRAPSVTNSVSDGLPDLHNILYQTGQQTMGPCCVYPR